MLATRLGNHPGTTTIVFGLMGVAVYALMIGITLAHIEAVSGQLPLDMRLFGYDPRDVAQLFDGLGEEGRWYYVSRQIPLDTVYPALMALTLVSAFRWLDIRLPYRRLTRIGITVSVGAALFDYGENLGIAVMIANWPNLSDPLVHWTSLASVSKSALTTLAVTLVFGLTALRMLQHKTLERS